MRSLPPVIAAVALAACHHAVAPPVVPVGRVLPAPIPPLVGDEQIGVALKYIDRTIGTGAPVMERQCVYVHYTGWLTDGTKFDSSRDTTPAGQPRTPIGFPVGFGRVISGWDQGFEKMAVGGQRRLFIPYALAYGRAGRPPVIPPRSELIFDLEVMAVRDTLPSAENRPQRGPTPQCAEWATVVSDSAKK
jgi:peptidylprolyl isomerase